MHTLQKDIEIFRLFGVFLELLRNLRGVSDGSKNLKRSIRLWAVFEDVQALNKKSCRVVNLFTVWPTHKNIFCVNISQSVILLCSYGNTNLCSQQPLCIDCACVCSLYSKQTDTQKLGHTEFIFLC